MDDLDEVVSLYREALYREPGSRVIPRQSGQRCADPIPQEWQHGRFGRGYWPVP